jgi:hypothetical protein
MDEFAPARQAGWYLLKRLQTSIHFERCCHLTCAIVSNPVARQATTCTQRQGQKSGLEQRRRSKQPSKQATKQATRTRPSPIGVSLVRQHTTEDSFVVHNGDANHPVTSTAPRYIPQFLQTCVHFERIRKIACASVSDPVAK